MNKVILIGNVGQDPEMRYTQGGDAILNLRIATNEVWFDKETKEKKEKTEWHSVSMFGKRADALGKIITKGSSVVIEGSLQTRQWESKGGEKHYSTEVKANNLDFVGGRKGGSGGAPSGDGESKGGFKDDDIPW